VGPSLDSFPASLSLPGSLPVVQETGVEQEGAVGRTRRRPRSNRRVSFMLDPRSGSGPPGGASDPAKTSNRVTEGSPPMTRARSQAKSVERGTPRTQKGKSKDDGGDLGSELDVGDSGEEGSVDHKLSPRRRSGVRGRTPGPGRG